MAHSYISGLVAICVSGCALPVCLATARRWRLYDLPGPLKIHDRPIPRIGGVAMMSGLAAGVFVGGVGLIHAYALPLVAFLLVWATGLADDFKSLPPMTRLVVHFAAGSLFWVGGWHLGWTDISFFDFLTTCLFVAFVVNAMNLLDGLDGLAAGTAAIVSLGFIPLFEGGAGRFPAALSWVLLAVCLSFLAINLPPARAFMGDSGSTLLGVTLAFLMLESVRTQQSSLSIVPVLMFLSLPLTDALLAVLRRLRRVGSPFQGDRRHFYDLLLRRGWSVYRVLAWSLGATCAMVLAGTVCLRNPAAMPYIVLSVVVGLASVTHLLDSLCSEPVGIEARSETVSVPPSVE